MSGPTDVLHDCLLKLGAGRDLTSAEAGAAMHAIMAGVATDLQAGAFAALLRAKGEGVSELLGCASRFQERVEPLDLGVRTDVVEIGGTGCGRGNSMIWAGAAFVAAAAGVKVVRLVTRADGEAIGDPEVLEALGVGLAASVPALRVYLQEVGIGFVALPTLGSAFERLDAFRRGLRFETVFNTVGVLVSATGAKRRVIGVDREKLVETVAMVLKRLGVQQAVVVHGLDGSDELTTLGKSKMCEVQGGQITASYVQPDSYGIRRVASSAAPNRTVEEAAIALRGAIHGESNPALDRIVLNAAAAIRVGGFASSFEKAVEVARRSVESGRPAELLERVVKLSARGAIESK